MPTLLLHQWEMSPFCNKVRRCLRHKGLAFEVKNYNGLEARKAAGLSPVGTLPVLDYDGERTVDSSAIARLLDARHPEAPLYPADPAELALARFWEDWAAQSLYFFEIHLRMLDPVAMEKALDLICAGRPGYERALMKMVLGRRYPKKLAAQGIGKLPVAEVERRLVEHLEGLEALLRGRDWLVGTAPSIADLSVVAQLDELVRTSRLADKIRSYPALRAWLERTPGAAG
ncbi:MAG: glutathione S-transferase family protein, partial [Deltaproteobacteria bacterium]|nr:glutathione S-transferase family protein [Deltaproteobacteria bacterium]